MNLLKTIMKHDKNDCYFKIKEFYDDGYTSIKIVIGEDIRDTISGYNLFGLSARGCILFNSISCIGKLDPPIDVSNEDKHLIINGIDSI